MIINEVLNKSSNFFHGTSDLFLKDILANGLKINESNKIYVTTSAFTAKVEAFNTVIGDMGYGITQWPPKPKEITSPGVGGQAIVLKLDGEIITQIGVKRDPEYPQEDQAYFTQCNIPSKAILGVIILGDTPNQEIIDYWQGT